jgi:hypothetical protein
MDHEQAILSMAAEKYLLNELPPELREAFEEHYFGCQECALDVRAGAAFIDHAKVVLSRPLASPEHEDHKDKKRGAAAGWLGWLRPAFAMPALAAVLLVVVGYQNFVIVPGLKAELTSATTPQVLNSVSLIRAHAQAGGTQARTIRRGQGLLLSVEFPSDERFSSYLGKLHSPSGKVLSSVSITPEQARDTVFVHVPGLRESGTYDFEVVGVGQDPSSSASVGHYSFDLQAE